MTTVHKYQGWQKPMTVLCRPTPVEHRAKETQHTSPHFTSSSRSATMNFFIRVWRPNFCQHIILLMTSTCPVQPTFFSNIWQKLKQSTKVIHLYQTKEKSYGSYLMHSETKRGAPVIVFSLPPFLTQSVHYKTTGWSKSLYAPDDYSTKNTQKQFQSLTMIT
jgi:hypothetical protein